MINLNNYETWFMLYADNELSVEERNHVIQFILLHPLLQDELDMMQEMKLLPDRSIEYQEKNLLKENFQLELESSICFEPDMQVVYPNKHELYRKETPGFFLWSRPFQVAAVLLIGLFWFINRPANEIKPLAASNSGESIKKPAVSDEKSSTVSDIVMVKHHPVKTSKQQVAFVTSPQVFSKDQMVSGVEDHVGVEKEAVAQEIISTKPVSNFTEEAVKSAAARISEESVSTAMITEQPIFQTYEEPEKSKKTPLRGLLRKITRTVLNENEENNGRNYVHVASFSIPVSKTNNK